MRSEQRLAGGSGGRYRNRVEFRARKSASSSILIRVDIGTEWNLELNTQIFAYLAFRVDIGTEWNLEFKPALILCSASGRYRNRVEFRDSRETAENSFCDSRYRNRVEFRGQGTCIYLKNPHIRILESFYSMK